MKFEEVIKDIQKQINSVKSAGELTEKEAQNTQIVHLTLKQIDVLFGKINSDGFVISALKSGMEAMQMAAKMKDFPEGGIVSEKSDHPEAVVSNSMLSLVKSKPEKTYVEVAEEVKEILADCIEQDFRIDEDGEEDVRYYYDYGRAVEDVLEYFGVKKSEHVTLEGSEWEAQRIRKLSNKSRMLNHREQNFVFAIIGVCLLIVGWMLVIAELVIWITELYWLRMILWIVIFFGSLYLIAMEIFNWIERRFPG